MKKIFLTILGGCLGFGLVAASPTKSPGVEAASRLAHRIVPEIAGNIIFEEIDAPADTFSVSQRDGKVLIKGSSPIAMSVGLNDYLLKDLGVDVSWYATTPVQVPASMSLPEGERGSKAVVPDRFFLNYCTFGYTMPYWNWSDWERFIDWMALNGVNLPLAMTGQEKAWYLTWKEFGLTDDEILSSFTGPAHLPWHWMNNVDHFQGPLSMAWLEDQAQLQKQILDRERELGMKPVLAAFAGHAPVSLKKHYPDANITLRSDWAEFDFEDRCYFLDPSDPLYAQVQKRYVAIQDSLFGTDHIYGIDPFNEIDSPDWSEDFLRNASAGIYNTLKEADPEARWLQMTWNFYYDKKNWTKPRMKAFLEGVPDDNLLLLDYFCDSAEVWRLNDRYFGKPYIWCYLGNFGGNTMLAGNLKDVDEKIRATVRDGGDNFTGIGDTLEGFDVNPVMHRYVLAKAWNPDLSPEEWINSWAKSRGAKENPEILEAWKILADSVYVKRVGIGQACMTNARPSLGDKTGHYTNPVYNYSDSVLLTVLDKLLSASKAEDNLAYQSDVRNITRQLLGNKFGKLRLQFIDAYNERNLENAKAKAAEMDEMLLDLDNLLSTDPDCSLETWVANARSHGHNAEEADKYERNARTLLTVWGPPGRQLNDYGNRQWSGLVKSFYRGRWNQFTNAVIAAMEKGTEFDQPAFVEYIKQWEGKWIDNKDNPSPRIQSKASDIARGLRQKHFSSNK